MIETYKIRYRFSNVTTWRTIYLTAQQEPWPLVRYRIEDIHGMHPPNTTKRYSGCCVMSVDNYDETHLCVNGDDITLRRVPIPYPLYPYVPRMYDQKHHDTINQKNEQIYEQHQHFLTLTEDERMVEVLKSNTIETVQQHADHISLNVNHSHPSLYKIGENGPIPHKSYRCNACYKYGDHFNACCPTPIEEAVGKQQAPTGIPVIFLEQHNNNTATEEEKEIKKDEAKKNTLNEDDNKDDDEDDNENNDSKRCKRLMVDKEGNNVTDVRLQQTIIHDASNTYHVNEKEFQQALKITKVKHKKKYTNSFIGAYEIFENPTSMFNNLQLDIEKDVEVIDSVLKRKRKFFFNKYPDLKKKKEEICKYNTRGLCLKGELLCERSHKFNIENVQICQFSLRNQCLRDNCTFRHDISVTQARLCKEYQKGFCPKGPSCEKSHYHLYNPPEFNNDMGMSKVEYDELCTFISNMHPR